MLKKELLRLWLSCLCFKVSRSILISIITMCLPSTDEISVGYDSDMLIPSGAIINQFGSLSRRSINRRNAIPSEPVGALTLDCITVTGQENPYWEISNNIVFNGTVMPNLTLSIAGGELEATIFVVPVSAYITTIALDIFEPELSGTYACTSSLDGPYSSVVLTDSKCMSYPNCWLNISFL